MRCIDADWQLTIMVLFSVHQCRIADTRRSEGTRFAFAGRQDARYPKQHEDPQTVFLRFTENLPKGGKIQTST